MTLRQAYALFNRMAPRLGFENVWDLMSDVSDFPRNYSEALQLALDVIQVEDPYYPSVE